MIDMTKSSPRALDLTLNTLDEATRSLASEMDGTRLIDRALETFADFGQSKRVALLMVEEDGKSLRVKDVLDHGRHISMERNVPLEGSALKEVIGRRRATCYPMLDGEKLPLPSLAPSTQTGQCLCLPLVGNHQLVMGVVTLDLPTGISLPSYQMQILNVVTTLFAVSLENARLFHLATVDSVTGLYARRYFEMRLEEEVSRISRHGGALSLLVTDIDQFKLINDRYGHQQGDLVLRELAKQVRATIRRGIDLGCRYGGEEFAIILPVTDLKGACDMAERVRRSCEELRFKAPLNDVFISLSGGVASMNREQLISGSELIRRADIALYQAKDSGRNQVRAWGISESTP
jgi:diguanylate cyclase (GGDEF)-like protein